MPIKRRLVLSGSAAGAVSLATGLGAPAIAQNEPIKIGYLPALTGPSSSTGVGINRGTQLAVELINNDGGIKGRKIELVSRDTQSDPTKAVNAVAELTQRQKVAMIFGPLNSGEALQHIANHPQKDKVWFTRPSDIYDHCASLPAGTMVLPAA